jgi:hypothetical protein
MQIPKHEEQVVMGIGWYRPEQWGRLLEVSLDADQLEKTHAEWLIFANKQLDDLKRRDILVIEVDVDVEELVRWCQRRGLAIDSGARAKFITLKAHDMGEKQA